MRTTIDRAGRLVVPKQLRERLALRSGGEVDIDERDGVLEIRPVSTVVELTMVDGRPVAEARNEVPALTDEDVRVTVERLRR